MGSGQDDTRWTKSEVQEATKHTYTPQEAKELELKKIAKEYELIKEVQRQTRKYAQHDSMDAFKRMTEGHFMSEDQRPKVDKLKAKRKELQNYLDKLDRCIAQSDKIQFKGGDVIYSKEHGPVVVTEVIVDIDEPAYANDPFAKEPFKFYYKGYAKGGMVSVRSDEALPYNETTKLLYEKNRS